MPLSEDAKKELADAIRIVREDKFEAFARAHIGTYKSSTEPSADPGKTGGGPADPPPPKTGEDPPDPPKPPKSGYWGELLTD